jgi:predicted RNase H-like nuclease
MKYPGTPFRRTWIEEVVSKPAIISLLKPNLSRTSKRKAQLTESKAFKISNLRRIRGCF